ncbi:MAG: HEAT repeat domain-containing protein [Gemmatimonadales bacterium]
MRVAVATVSIVVVPAAAVCQALDRRVVDAGDGTVQFHFAARTGVCGDGRGFFRVAESGYSSSYNVGSDGEDCGAGPVRVVLVRAGREIVRIESYAGPLAADPDGGKDLGAVGAREAASYLLGLAATLDGRPAREAVTPAMLADSSVVTPELLQLARDQSRSRDVRSIAISWLARRRTESGGVGSDAAVHALDALVRDHGESESIRRTALSVLGNLDRGEGVPLLIGFAGDPDTWISRSAIQSLANAGDPRARQYLRTQLQRGGLPADVGATVIRGVGNQYATGADLQLLRGLYGRVDSDQERNAIISAVSSAGGAANIDWLLEIARSPTETAARRRQAISVLSRSGDPRVNDALKGMVEGSRP